MTTASSTSQSSIFDPPGSATLVPGPTTLDPVALSECQGFSPLPFGSGLILSLRRSLISSTWSL